MLPALPVMSASIPPVIDLSFGLMPLVAAIVIVAVGAAEILRAVLANRGRRARRPRFHHDLARPMLAVK
jgi:hypothetical protein